MAGGICLIFSPQHFNDVTPARVSSENHRVLWSNLFSEQLQEAILLRIVSIELLSLIASHKSSDANKRALIARVRMPKFVSPLPAQQAEKTVASKPADWLSSLDRCTNTTGQVFCECQCI